MSTTPKIEKGIPIPATKNRGFYIDIAKKMQRGDSVLYKTASEASGLRQAGKYFGKEMVTRKMEDGHRVWCVGPMKKLEDENGMK